MISSVVYLIGGAELKRTLILGAGFGGLTVATELRRLLGDEYASARKSR